MIDGPVYPSCSKLVKVDIEISGVVSLSLFSQLTSTTPSALNQSLTEIKINFKPSTNATIFATDPLPSNTMTIRVQPSEGVFLRINTFVPSLDTQQTTAMDLDLTYHGREIPEAYEVLFLDALKGDKARSVRGDELDASWKIWTPLLHLLDDESKWVKPRDYAYGQYSTLYDSSTDKFHQSN